MEQWLVIVNDASILYQLKLNLGLQAALKVKRTFTILQKTLQVLTSLLSGVVQLSFPLYNRNDLWNNSQSPPKLNAARNEWPAELWWERWSVSGLKATSCFAFMAANLSCLQRWLKQNRTLFACTVSGLCLQPGCQSILGHQLLMLLLACLSSSTKQMWGRPSCKYSGFCLDGELCNTHRHTHKTYFVASAKTGGRNNRRWARHIDLSNCTVSCASEFVEIIQSQACILVSRPQTRVLVTGTLTLWKLLCLNSLGSQDNS